jgi:hypothetical protein
MQIERDFASIKLPEKVDTANSNSPLPKPLTRNPAETENVKVATFRNAIQLAKLIV